MLTRSPLDSRSEVRPLHRQHDGNEVSTFAEAIRTDPVEIKAMGRDVSRHDIAHSIMEVILRRNCEISHNAALLAHEMVVLVNHSVVTVKPFAEIEFANLSLRCKDMEISVDCAKGDLRNLLANLLKDPFCRGMRRGSLQHLKNLLPLSASFCTEGLHATIQSAEVGGNISKAPSNVKVTTSGGFLVTMPSQKME